MTNPVGFSLNSGKATADGYSLYPVDGDGCGALRYESFSFPGDFDIGVDYMFAPQTESRSDYHILGIRDTNNGSLGMLLMFNQSGAVSVWAPSSFDDPSGQISMNCSLLTMQFNTLLLRRRNNVGTFYLNGVLTATFPMGKTISGNVLTVGSRHQYYANSWFSSRGIYNNVVVRTY